MLDRNELCTLLSDSGICFSESDVDKVLSKTAYLGKEFYVPTQYLSGRPFEVIKVTVTLMRLSTRNSRKTFSVEGVWSSGSHYNGTFNINSISRTIFNTKEEAQNIVELKNSKLNKSKQVD